MSELTPAERPENLSTEPAHRLAGDWNDDDGQAIEEYFEPAFHGEEEQTYVDAPRESLPTTNRLLSRTIPFPYNSPLGEDISFPPILAFPADSCRKNITMYAIQYSGDGRQTAATALVRVASDRTGTYDVGNFHVSPMAPRIYIEDYTGPIWVQIQHQGLGIPWNQDINLMVTVVTE